jgi:hypothetical protein
VRGRLSPPLLNKGKTVHQPIHTIFFGQIKILEFILIIFLRIRTRFE